MSWTRAELKARAKTAFYRNYWKCVLVALILGLISGGGSGGSSSSSSYSSSSYEDDYDYEDNYNYEYNYNYSDAKTADYQVISTMASTDAKTISTSSEETLITLLTGGLAITIFLILLVIIVISSLISIFVFAPLQVGGCHFFLENASVNTAPIGALVKAFKTNYKTTVLTMFLRGLYTTLWTLLFIIPGIVKSYEYYMIPYILADHPELNHKEVFELSKKMMDGEKMNTFVLGWSFFGWQLLNLLTFGILGIFYVNPYVHATDAELYLAVKRIKCTTYQPYNTYNTSPYISYSDNNSPYNYQ